MQYCSWYIGFQKGFDDKNIKQKICLLIVAFKELYIPEDLFEPLQQ